MSMNNVPTVAISDIPEMIRLSAVIGTPLIIWGPPGVGKSAMVKQYAKSINGVLVDIRLSQYDAVDLRGLPDTSKCGTQTVWLMPSTMPFEGNDAFPDDQPVVLFLDEIMQASPALQAIAFQLLHPDDRCVGEHKLKSNVIVVGASNRDTDRAGVKKMLTPLANRVMHTNVESNLDSWKEWALGNGINPMLVGFLNFRPEYLSQFEDACASSAKAFPTERSWEAVSKVLSVEVDQRMRRLGVSAIVGEGVSAELMAFIEVADSLPKWQQIVDNPTDVPVPSASQRDVLCAVCSMIYARVDSQTGDKVVPYIRRLPREYQAMVVNDICRGKLKLTIQCANLQALSTELSNEIYS